MVERPIIFSAPMVRALLAGTKTQTRRIAKVNSDRLKPGMVTPNAGYTPRSVREHLGYCPYGKPGDRLWVRETCRAHELTDREAEEDTFGIIEAQGLELPPYGLDGVVYAADNTFRVIENSPAASEKWTYLNGYRGKDGAPVPSIHMPRWASRITLELTEIRLERLNEISSDDAAAEGWPGPDENNSIASAYPIAWYWHLWDQINGSGSWDANPWVWALTFKCSAASISPGQS